MKEKFNEKRPQNSDERNKKSNKEVEKLLLEVSSLTMELEKEKDRKNALASKYATMASENEVLQKAVRTSNDMLIQYTGKIAGLERALEILSRRED